MSTAQRDRLDRACLKFERAGPRIIICSTGRAGLKAGTGRAEKFRPVHSSSLRLTLGEAVSSLGPGHGKCLLLKNSSGFLGIG